MKPRPVLALLPIVAIAGAFMGWWTYAQGSAASRPQKPKGPILSVVVDRADLGRVGSLSGQVAAMAADGQGNLFLADTFVGARPADVRCQIRERVAATGTVRVVGGALAGGAAGKTPAERLALSGCQNLAVDQNDNVYLISSPAPYGRYPLQLFRISGRTGAVRVIAGCSTCYGFHPRRPPTQSSVNYVPDLAVDGSSDVLLLDAYTSAIWSLSPGGVLKRIAGSVCRFPPNSFICPTALAPGTNGTIYFDGERDRKVVEALNVATRSVVVVAGGGHCRVSRLSFCGNHIPATQAKVAGAGDLAVDGAGNLFLIGGSMVQRVNAKTHRIAIVAGNGSLPDHPLTLHRGESLPALATAIEPGALATAPHGTLYIADGASGAVLALRPKD